MTISLSARKAPGSVKFEEWHWGRRKVINVVRRGSVTGVFYVAFGSDVRERI